jgi:hypothetical protein
VAKLYDITFYTFELDNDFHFRKICNYVADIYQNNLGGYKPPKTTRIGLFLDKEKNWDGKPWRNGSIIHLSGVFDELNFRKLDEKRAMRYLLDILHRTIIEHCDELSWDSSVFDKAYYTVIKSDFQFTKTFEEVISRDKKNQGQIVLRKTVDTTNVHFILNGQDKKVYSNENRYWMDPWYDIKKSYKWFDNDRFGVQFAEGQFRFFYSLTKNQLGYEIIPKKMQIEIIEENFKRLIRHVNAT